MPTCSGMNQYLTTTSSSKAVAKLIPLLFRGASKFQLGVKECYTQLWPNTRCLVQLEFVFRSKHPKSHLFILPAPWEIYRSSRLCIMLGKQQLRQSRFSRVDRVLKLSTCNTVAIKNFFSNAKESEQVCKEIGDQAAISFGSCLMSDITCNVGLVDRLLLAYFFRTSNCFFKESISLRTCSFSLCSLSTSVRNRFLSSSSSSFCVSRFSLQCAA